jgi:hypothetical protein
VYDPTTGSVFAGPSMSTARAGHSATTLLNGKVLVAGGAGNSSELASAEIFDPTSNAFTPADNLMAAPRQRHLAFLLPHNNNVLIVGGMSGGSAIATAEMFVPWEGTGGAFCSGSVCSSGYAGPLAPGAARTWATGSALSFPASATNRSGPADGLLLLAGGTRLKSAELYGFPTIKTDKDDYAPGTTVTITGSGWQPGEWVALLLKESPTLDEHPLVDVQADAKGDIVSTEFVPDEHDLGIRFYLTAFGQQSQAQTTFTDSKDITFTFAGSGSGSVLVSTAGQTNQTISSSCSGGGACKANITDNSGTGTLTATANAGSVFAGWSLQSGGVTGCSGNTCNFAMSGAGQSVRATFNLNASTTTTVTSPSNPSVYGQSVTFTAKVGTSGSSTPTGSVQFVVDGSNFGSLRG